MHPRGYPAGTDDMKARVERGDLTDAAAWAVRAVPNRPTIPILSGVLVVADPTGLAVTGFDFEQGARIRVDAAVAEAGRVLVSGRLLAEISRALPGAPVDLESEGSRLVVTCGSSRFELPTMPVEDYPQLPELPPVSGRITAASFAAAVGQVALAAGKDDTLPALTGVRVEIDGEQVTLAATDRYRLAVRELRWRPEGDAGDLPAAALIPARTLADTAKAFAGSDAEVTVAFAGAGESLVGFAAGDRITTTRLLDGEFPRYRSLLPSGSNAWAEFDIADVVDAVRRVRLVLARTSPVRLSFTSDEVVLDAGSGDEAQARERLSVHYEGEPMTIAFNPDYLLDGLTALDSDTARMSFTEPSKPTVLTGKSADYRYLLMPVRLMG